MCSLLRVTNRTNDLFRYIYFKKALLYLSLLLLTGFMLVWGVEIMGRPIKEIAQRRQKMSQQTAVADVRISEYFIMMHLKKPRWLVALTRIAFTLKPFSLLLAFCLWLPLGAVFANARNIPKSSNLWPSQSSFFLLTISLSKFLCLKTFFANQNSYWLIHSWKRILEN